RVHRASVPRQRRKEPIDALTPGSDRDGGQSSLVTHVSFKLTDQGGERRVVGELGLEPSQKAQPLRGHADKELPSLVRAVRSVRGAMTNDTNRPSRGTCDLADAQCARTKIDG